MKKVLSSIVTDYWIAVTMIEGDLGNHCKCDNAIMIKTKANKKNRQAIAEPAGSDK